MRDKIINIFQKLYKRRNISTYCCYCKKHMRGKDVGYMSKYVSHGVCDECYRREVKKLLNEQ